MRRLSGSKIGVSGKLALWLAAAAFAVVAIMGAMHYHRGMLLLGRELDLSLRTVTNRLGVSLEQSVYEFNTSTIRSTLLAEFADEDLAAAVVWSRQEGRPPELLVGLVRIDGEIRDVQIEPSEEGWMRRGKELADPEKGLSGSIIGDVTVWLDPSLAERRLLASLGERVLETALVVLVLVFLLTFVANRYVVAPLERVRLAMLAVQDTDVQTASNPIAPDHTAFHELRRMGASFEQMVETLGARESSLRDSERRYSDIFNNSSDAIFIHDAETGEILDVNDRMLEMYRCTRDQAVGGDG